MARVSSNVPRDPLRWSVLRAAEEFGLDQVTLRKKLTASEQPAGEDGCYSTSQIMTALHDDSKALKDKEVKERGDNWELRNKILRGELLDRSDVTKALESVFSVIGQIIKASSLSKKQQKDILDNIAEYPVVLEGVARRQSSQTKKPDSED